MVVHASMRVLRVFVDERREFGNPVGVIVDTDLKVSKEKRQEITKKTGFSECVFVDNLVTRKVSIYNPEHEVKFAGHALVGTAYLMGKLVKEPVEHIECKAGTVKVRVEGDKIWISASLENTPPWIFKELEGPDEVDDLTFGQRKNFEHTVVWAWINKEKGLVRARTFAPDWGIPEDEANGSGSMQISAQLNRELEIHHGKGSVIYTRPIEGNMVEVGGRVKENN